MFSTDKQTAKSFIYSRIDTIKSLYFFLYMSINQYIIINYQYTLNYFNK